MSNDETIEIQGKKFKLLASPDLTHVVGKIWILLEPLLEPEKSFEEEIEDEVRIVALEGQTKANWASPIIVALVRVFSRRLAALKKELGGR